MRCQRLLTQIRFKSNQPFIKNKKEKLDPRVQLLKTMLYSGDEFDPKQNRTQLRSVGEGNVDQPIRGIVLDSTLHECTEKEVTITSEEELKQDMIEREWCMDRYQRAKEFLSIQKRKYESIRKAMLELEKLDQRLFEGTKQEYKYFPTQYRIPTETMPTKGWQ
jgi:F0F1-type ATP synthase epsilon subunit